jgi:hypothetical protein
MPYASQNSPGKAGFLHLVASNNCVQELRSNGNLDHWLFSELPAGENLS